VIVVSLLSAQLSAIIRELASTHRPPVYATIGYAYTNCEAGCDETKGVILLERRWTQTGVYVLLYAA
jgi:hypothetical protein